MKGIVDLNGVLLKDGQTIKFLEFLPLFNETFETVGQVVEKDDGFYLKDRKLELLDQFYIITQPSHYDSNR